MLPLSRILLLVVVACYVDGNQRIIHVSELVSDNKDSITSGEGDNSLICCVYGNCSCSSLDHALANLTSNVLINITTDVTLSSLVTVSDLENVSIIGHNNPHCELQKRWRNTLCNNCIIQGITWDGCGTEKFNISDDDSEPGLKLSKSSNVTIQSCSFQHSVGQAIVLSEMLGDVSINNCMFMDNSHYRGHGTAVHYSSNTRKCSNFEITISKCSFSYNKMKSLVYLENRLSKCNKIRFNNCIFYGSQGTSLYAINHNIYLNKKFLFQNNTALNGTGIYISDYSTVVFDKDSDVTFTQNSANYRGGAIFLSNHSILLFEHNSVVTFTDNKATNGTVYSEANSNVTFKGACQVSFSSNSATQYGAAIYSTDNSHVTFTGNAMVIFNSNFVSSNESNLLIGGILYCVANCITSFEANSTTLFSNNTAQLGGAILSNNNSIIYFEGNATTVFHNNNAYSVGGAINTNVYSNVSFAGNSITVFNNNSAVNGGAIICFDYSNIHFEKNSTVVFSNNTAHDNGGAILTIYHCNITFDGNSTVTFNSNSAKIGATVYSAISSKLITKRRSRIIINYLTAKWCYNTCLPYTGQDDVLTIDNNGIVWCTDQNAFICISNKCHCKSLEGILQPGTGVKHNVHITDDIVVLSSTIHINADDVIIVGHNNNTVICVDGGRIEVKSSQFDNSELIIEGITWIGCGIVSKYLGVLQITNYDKVTIEKCVFQYSVGPVVTLLGVMRQINIIDCKFVNTSHFSGDGAAIAVYSIYNAEIFNAFTIKGCYFYSNRGSKNIISVYFSPDTYSNVYLINSIFHNNEGACINLSGYASFILHINREVLFENNTAENGAGIYISGHSTVTFGENSNTKFINNFAYYNGAVIFLKDHSSVIFDQNSIVTFTDNKATNGTVYSEASSSITFKGTCEVAFSSNSATQYGAAIYSTDNSHVTFTGITTVYFTNNVVPSNDKFTKIGGTIFSENFGYISFEGNSIADNFANFGTAIFSINNSNVIFKDKSRVVFNNNTVHYCGVLTSAVFSNVTFTDYANVIRI